MQLLSTRSLLFSEMSMTPTMSDESLTMWCARRSTSHLQTQIGITLWRTSAELTQTGV